jgi:hypothetical protein
MKVGATVRFTPLAAAHWREYREGVVKQVDGDTVVVRYDDGTERTVPAGDVDVVAMPKQSRAVNEMIVAGDDASNLSEDVVESGE